MFLNNITLRRLTACVAIVCSSLLLSACEQASQAKKIGIIVPIEHQAMNEIVAGFKETLMKDNPDSKIKVANAQGDINLQRAIIQQMRDEKYDIIVPIGTDATQMTIAMVHNQPIVSLASSITDQERQSLKKCNVAVVHDEIQTNQYLQFITTTYPHLKNITLIHSSSEKIYPEVKSTIEAGKKLGISITALMAQNLSDLSIIANNIPKDTQAILILKDSLIVSGITTLEKAAERNHIPLISSDQGSVQNGAGMALGVHERDIGEQGALLASQILASKPACQLPIIDMTKLTIFINQDALQKSGQSIDPVKNTASVLHYQLEPTQKG